MLQIWILKFMSKVEVYPSKHQDKYVLSKLICIKMSFKTSIKAF